MNRKARLWFGVSAVLLIMCSVLVSAQEARQALQHHVRTVVANGEAKPVGALPATQRLNFSIVLPLRNQAELSKLLGRLYDPSSPDYHHYLSVPEFTEQFGPTAQEYQDVIVAEANGFQGDVVWSPTGMVAIPERSSKLRRRSACA